MPEKHEKTRILFVITQAEMGGAQRFVANLIRSLDADRFECSVAVGREGSQDLRTMLGPETEYFIVEHLTRSVRPFHNLRSVLELVRLFRSLRPDVLFLNSSMAGFVGSAAARLSRPGLPRMQVVYRIGGWTFNDPWPFFIRWTYLVLEWISARFKDVIVVNNRHDLEQAHRLGIRPRRRLALIHNGIDPYLPFLEATQARKRFVDNIPPEVTPSLLVGTIANFYPTKDLPSLVAAAAATDPSIHFFIIGDGPERHTIVELIMEYGVGGRVHLVGRLADAYRYLPAFDMFVLPSVKEGFPWAVLEAMAAKVPIIATRVGAVPEVLDDGVSGILVEPRKPEQIAAAITRLATNAHARKELAIQAHQRLLSRFTLRHMLERYEQLFSSLH